MKRTLMFAGLLFIALSISCNSIIPAKTAEKPKGPVIDFTAPGKPLDVKVLLDKKQTASGKISASGGSVSLTAADGSKFTLDVPAGALESETTITMTAVKSLDGAPLDKNTPTAVQLEPSGLFFQEMATLTIVPAKEIPVKEQIIFGYEGDGKDYHLAQVDPKSKDIKIKLMQFSGASVGSGSDTAWSANLAIQAGGASVRLMQKIAEFTLIERQRQLLGDRSGEAEWFEKMRSSLDQFEDQVVLKGMVAAELDCKHGMQAWRDLIFLERQRQLLGLDSSPKFAENDVKLRKIIKECKRAYRVNGVSNNVSFTGEICDVNQSFTINAKYPGGDSKTTFSGGATTVSGGGSGCTHSGGGTYTLTPNEDGSDTLKWTTSDTIACPLFSNSKTATFTLQLQPAPDLSCP